MTGRRPTFELSPSSAAEADDDDDGAEVT